MAKFDSFGQWAKKTREDKGLNLQQVADAGGCSVSSVHDVETKDSDFRIETLLKVSKGLGYRLSTALRKCGM